MGWDTKKTIVSIIFISFALLYGSYLFLQETVKQVELISEKAVKQERKIRDHLFGVGGAGTDNVWVVGYRGTILHSNDRGKNWDLQSSGVDWALADTDFLNPRVGWVVGRHGTCLYTDDGGEHWQKQCTGVTKYLLGVDFVDKNEGWIVGEGGVILHTMNGGNTWEQKEKPPLSQALEDLMIEAPILNEVFFIDSRQGWIVGEAGTLLRTRNGGESWQQVEVGTTTTMFDIKFHNKIGIAVGLNGFILRSGDGGETWEKADNDFKGHIFELDFVVRGNSLYIFAVGQGTFIFSHSDGVAWDRVTRYLGPDLTYRWLSAIIFTGKQGWIVGEDGFIVKTGGTAGIRGELSEEWVPVEY